MANNRLVTDNGRASEAIRVERGHYIRKSKQNTTNN